MEHLDLSFPTPYQNLACDEALLDLCEETYPGEILRLWGSRQYFVVLGYSNKILKEVNINSCQSDGIPVLRRPSGGGAVLQGPGCLNFSLIFHIDLHPEVRSIITATQFVMAKNRQALEELSVLPVQVRGISDLTLDNLKFSGNAQRRKKNCLLFHGTFLLDMDLGLISKYLRLPSKQPDYRENRSHQDFLTNLGLCEEKLKEKLRVTWEANRPFTDQKKLAPRIENLIQERYSQSTWNEKF